MKILPAPVKISWKTEIELSALFHMKTRACFKYFVNEYRLHAYKQHFILPYVE